MHGISRQSTYDIAALEKRWQERWEQEGCFVAGSRAGRPRQYHYPAGPFTNGRLHLGHVRTFVLADVMARAARQRGHDVLYAFEWDAFGLPTELVAQERSVSPATLAADAASQMRADLERLGLSVDWSHVQLTCDPRYYRWTQWLFLRLLERDLVYRATAMLNFCTTCDTTLAHLEVEQGTCWRCHSLVERRELTQWFIRLADASRMLLDTLPGLHGWSETLRRLLAGFIGPVEGTEVDLEIDLGDGTTAVLTAFVADDGGTTQVDAVQVAPGSREVAAVLRAGGDGDGEALVTSAALRRRRREDVAAEERDTGLRARHPTWPVDLPVLASSVVDPSFAHGVVLRPAKGNGVDIPAGRPVLHHHVHDWLVSRQRSWGTPLPVVTCEACGDVPLPDDRLPLELDIGPDATRRITPVPCPRCAGAAIPTGDSLDCFFDVSWALTAIATSLPDDVEQLAAEARSWGPADWFHNGFDSFFYAHLHRFIGHVLHDLGITAEAEPARNFHGHAMVKLDGRKMSKHEGNAVDARALLDQFGADSLRIQILWAANPLQPVDFQPGMDRQAANLLAAVRSMVLDNAEAILRWASAGPDAAASPASEELDQAVEQAIERVSRFIDCYRPGACVEEINRLCKRLGRASRAVAFAHDEPLCAAFAGGAVVLVQLLQPFAPHLAEELWASLGKDGLLSLGPWPAPRGFAGASANSGV